MLARERSQAPDLRRRVMGFCRGTTGKPPGIAEPINVERDTAAGSLRGAVQPGRHRLGRAELAAAIEAARAAHAQASTVRGGSLLYHLPAYRASLWPALLAGATPANPADELEFMALFAQFVCGYMDLDEPRARQFVGAFRAAPNRAQLLASFPLPKLDWEGPLGELSANLNRANSSKWAIYLRGLVSIEPRLRVSVNVSSISQAAQTIFIRYVAAESMKCPRRAADPARFIQ
jgi:hypothetical protein